MLNANAWEINIKADTVTMLYNVRLDDMLQSAMQINPDIVLSH